MANYSALTTAIRSTIKTNGNNEITGAILQSALTSMINSLGAGYQFKGVATTSTNPGSPDQKVFYLAKGAGTFTNFGGITLGEGEIGVLYWDSSWHKSTIDVGQVYMGTYSSSSKPDYETLKDAFDEGLAVFLKASGKRIYMLVNSADDVLTFSCINGKNSYVLTVDSDDNWASSSLTLATASEVNAKYTKPSSGIPESDLSSAVRTKLNKSASVENETLILP